MRVVLPLRQQKKQQQHQTTSAASSSSPLPSSPKSLSGTNSDSEAVSSSASVVGGEPAEAGFGENSSGTGGAKAESKQAVASGYPCPTSQEEPPSGSGERSGTGKGAVSDSARCEKNAWRSEESELTQCTKRPLAKAIAPPFDSSSASCSSVHTAPTRSQTALSESSSSAGFIATKEPGSSATKKNASPFSLGVDSAPSSSSKQTSQGRYKSQPESKSSSSRDRHRKRKQHCDSRKPCGSPYAHDSTQRSAVAEPSTKKVKQSIASASSQISITTAKQGHERSTKSSSVAVEEGRAAPRKVGPPKKKSSSSKMGRGIQHRPNDENLQWENENFSRNIYDEDNRQTNYDEPIEIRNEGGESSLRYNDNSYNVDNNLGQENDPAYAAEASSSAQDLMSPFEEALKKRGLEMIRQEGDGNCLFRAVSLQIYGDASMHGEVRKRCLDFMAKDEAHFAQFVTGESFGDYIRRKRHDGVHGNNPEIQAISELFNRPVEVFVPENGATPLNIFHAEYKTADAPIRLSYHDGNHYNAVIDPLCPTAGLGLGLPGLEPGLADRMQVAKAVEESDKVLVEKVVKESQKDQMQRAIKESKNTMDQMYKKKALALSDLEATDFDLEQAVLASSMESYQNTEVGRKQPWSNRDRRRQQGGSPITSRNSSRFNEHSASSSSWVEPAASSASSASQPAPAAAAAAARPAEYDDDDIPPQFLENARDEYPEMVQELVMNGFELPRVLRAYELIGNNFDDVLAFLMSSS